MSLDDLSRSPASAIEIIAHRGASADAPENSLAAVRLAWQQKADAVEVDLRLTRDRQVILMHDATTERTTGLNRTVAEQSLNELRALDVGRWKGAAWAGEIVPTLQDVLEILPPAKRLFLELKSGPEIVPALHSILSASPARDEQIAIIGFSYELLVAARKAFPGRPIYWICTFDWDPTQRRWMPDPQMLIQRAKDSGLDGIDLEQRGPFDADLIRMIRAANLRVFAWTIDSPEIGAELGRAGIDGITTNYPGPMRKLLVGEE